MDFKWRKINSEWYQTEPKENHFLNVWKWGSEWAYGYSLDKYELDRKHKYSFGSTRKEAMINAEEYWKRLTK